MNANQIKRVWIRNGGDPRKADLFARIALSESSGRAGVVNSIGATGLWQIYNHPSLVKQYGDMRNPDANAKAAIALSSNGRNLRPWDASKHAWGSSMHLSGTPGGGGGTAARTKTVTTPGVNNSVAMSQVMLDYLLHGSSHDTQGSGIVEAVTKIAQLSNEERPPTTKTVRIPDSVPSGGNGRVGQPSGTTMIDGKPVANWIAARLLRARRAGAQFHVSSGYRSVAEQRRIYNSGVRPAAKPGQSNHNFTAYPGGAVDIDQGQQSLADTLQRLRIKKLQYAGAKDPVHFSHPHNGSY